MIPALIVKAVLSQGTYVLPEAGCNPQLDTVGVCLFKEQQYALAIGQLHSEIDRRIEEEVHSTAIASLYLWLGAAYVNLRGGGDDRLEDEFAEQAFRQARVYDAKVQVEALGTYATEPIKERFAKAMTRSAAGVAWRRPRDEWWLRFGVMSGSLFRPGYLVRYEQPLGLNLHAMVGWRTPKWGLVFGTGGSPNLRGSAGIVGVGFRPSRRRPVTIMMGWRFPGRGTKTRLAIAVGADFRILGR